MKPLVIIGAGGLGKEIAWLIEENNKIRLEWDILGYISKDIDISAYKYPVLGDDDWLLTRKDIIYAVCSIGNPVIRQSIAEKYKDIKNIIFPNIISSHAIVSDTVSFGRGSIICPGSVITVNIKLGDYIICDRNTTIGHDSIIDDFVTISPGANLSGNVSVGSTTMIGTGSNIIQGISIGQYTTIGAGATVINDIPNHSVAVGVPAKVIKHV